MAVIVDSIKTAFKNLFCIRLDHAGYETTLPGVVKSSILQDLEIQPDENTAVVFANHQLGFLCNNNNIICYIRSAGTGAFLPLPDTSLIRLMIGAGPGFIKRTAIEPAGSKQVYQFTNLARSGGGSDKYLTTNSGGVSPGDLFAVAAVGPSTPCLAVIDIYTKDVGNDYRLFDSSGNVLGGNYRIGFPAV